MNPTDLDRQQILAIVLVVLMVGSAFVGVLASVF